MSHIIDEQKTAKELGILSFHGMKYVNTTQINWFFMVPLLFCIYLWFHDLKKKKINLTLRRLQIYSETIKLIFNISKNIYFFTLI